MDHQHTIIDKTREFQRLQQELQAGGIGCIGIVANELARAEETLKPYFENPSRISQALRGGALRYENAFLLQNSGEAWITETLQSQLKDFRSARDTDANACFHSWGSWMEPADRGIRNISTVAQLEADRTHLSPEVLAKSCLRDVGDMLEGSLRPYACLRLSMRDVATGRTRIGLAVASMTFGAVVAELTSSGTPDDDVYRPLTLGLTVSQWRNIANHNSYEVRGDEAICTYGSPGNLKRLRLPVSTLVDVVKYVNDLCFTHKIAFEFFSIDNIHELTRIAPELPITESTKNGAIVSGLVSSGFSIVNAGVKDGAIALVLLDNKARTKFDAKCALQEAVNAYVLLFDSIEIVAVVQSANSSYRFSFRGWIPRSSPLTL